MSAWWLAQPGRAPCLRSQAPGVLDAVGSLQVQHRTLGFVVVAPGALEVVAELVHPQLELPQMRRTITEGVDHPRPLGHGLRAGLRTGTSARRLAFPGRAPCLR